MDAHVRRGDAVNVWLRHVPPCHGEDDQKLDNVSGTVIWATSDGVSVTGNGIDETGPGPTFIPIANVAMIEVKNREPEFPDRERGSAHRRSETCDGPAGRTTRARPGRAQSGRTRRAMLSPEGSVKGWLGLT